MFFKNVVLKAQIIINTYLLIKTVLLWSCQRFLNLWIVMKLLDTLSVLQNDVGIFTFLVYPSVWAAAQHMLNI